MKKKNVRYPESKIQRIEMLMNSVVACAVDFLSQPDNMQQFLEGKDFCVPLTFNTALLDHMDKEEIVSINVIFERANHGR